MNSTHKQHNKGFTIIEVVLVLAIAALIFLMVFIALPALQRSQRDTQRKDDLARASTAIQNYQSNNQNQLPLASGDPNGTTFIKNYLTVGGSTFQDPSGSPYTFTKVGVTDSIPTYSSDVSSGNGKVSIYYATDASCGTDEGTFSAGSGSQKIAMILPLEGGGDSCVSN